MKANAPKKLYISNIKKRDTEKCYSATIVKYVDDDIEYIRTNAFIEKAKKWFEQQPETYDANGVRVYGEEDFEDFVNYMKGE